MYRQVQPANVEQHWALVAPWIAQAIGGSDSWKDIDEIKKLCIDGSAHIFIGYDLQNEIDVVLVTETWMFDGRKTLVLRWLAGKNMNQWFQDYDVLEAWAAGLGFQDVHIWGRPGFVKMCKPLGFRHEFTVISKPIMRGLQ